VHTKILAGNPAAAGFYSILLFAPPRTTIQAHSHRDDPMATVVSGAWHFGYGAHFDQQALKTFPVAEPGGVNHFAHRRSARGRTHLWELTVPALVEASAGEHAFIRVPDFPQRRPNRTRRRSTY
jgi:hypothetical protein